jgi:hypothetical protein
MEDFTTGWTKEELKIYTLIYCANADFFESHFEISYIKSKIKDSDFDSIYKEFKSDNDYKSVQKIKKTIEDLGYSDEEKEALFDEMRELFLSDGKYQSLEQNLNRALNNILN